MVAARDVITHRNTDRHAAPEVEALLKNAEAEVHEKDVIGRDEEAELRMMRDARNTEKQAVHRMADARQDRHRQ